MSRKLVIRVVGIALVTLCLITGIGLYSSSEIDGHKRAIARLHFPYKPKSLPGYFSSAYLLWNLNGRPSFSEVMQRYEEHIVRLVDLGYLERRSFTLEHQPTNGNWSAQLDLIVRPDARLKEPLASWSMIPISKVVTVTTRPDQMKNWEELLRQFDSTNRPPDKLPSKSSN